MPDVLQTNQRNNNPLLIILIVLLLLITLGTGYAFWQYKQLQVRLTQESELALVSRDAILQKVQTLSKLETIEFTIETVITTEKQGTWYKLWQDNQKGLFIARGRVQAGIDLKKLTSDDIKVDDNGRATQVNLPQVEIFQVFLDDIQVYDFQKGVLASHIDNQIFQKVQTDAKYQILSTACQSDILSLANNSAEKQIQTLFNMITLPSHSPEENNHSISVVKNTLPKCHLHITAN